MVAKLVMLVGLLGVGGYVAHTVKGYDPDVYPYSRAQVQAMLADAETKLPRRDGPGEIRIWGTGRSTKGASMKMRYSSTAPVIDCQAVVTEVSPEKSRVTADCGPGYDTSSAMARTQAALRTPMFAEHIQATLNKRAFDRSNVDRKEQAVVLQDIGGMQREAMKIADEEQRRHAGQ